MPRRSILSAAERDGLMALPDAKDELIRLYTFDDDDLAIIRQHRGPANRLGFAIQLCYMRYPGVLLAVDAEPFPPLLRMVAAQTKVLIDEWPKYGRAPEHDANTFRSCKPSLAFDRSAPGTTAHLISDQPQPHE